MTDIFDQMTSEVTERKADAGATLTPVGREKGGPAAKGPVLPNDLPGMFMSSEVMGETARTLRYQAQHLWEVADAIDRFIEESATRGGPQPGEHATPQDEQKAREAAADAAHKAREGAKVADAAIEAFGDMAVDAAGF